MIKHEARRAWRLAVLPAACAALLSACAPFEPWGTTYSGSGAPVDSGVSLFDQLDVNRDGFLSRAEVESLGVRSHSGGVESTNAAFQRYDTNGDAYLSRTEAQSLLTMIPGASFDSIDRDRDGFISFAEASPHLRWLESRNAPSGTSFEGFDTNRDGLLSRAEAEPLLRSHAPAYGAPPVTHAFDALDTNRDGFLSRSEAASIANPPTFDRHDANRDGFLSRIEADPLLRPQAPHAGAPVMHSFDSFDTNRDGFLSRNEAAPIANPPTFDRYDTNRDGFLSRAEAEPLLRYGVGGTGPSTGSTVYGPRY